MTPKILKVAAHIENFNFLLKIYITCKNVHKCIEEVCPGKVQPLLI